MKRKKEKEEQTDPKTANDFLKEKAKTNESTEDESDSDNDTLPSEDDSDIESYATPNFTPKPSFFHQSPFTDPSVTPRSISSASLKMTEKEEQWKLTVQRRQKRSNISSPEGQNQGKVSKKELKE